MPKIGRGAGAPTSRASDLAETPASASPQGNTPPSETANTAADATTAHARDALRALALDVKVEPDAPSGASRNGGARSAELGASLMQTLGSDGAKKVYVALGIGINLLGLARTASADTFLAGGRLPVADVASQLDGGGFVHVKGEAQALRSVFEQLAGGQLSTEHLILEAPAGGVDVQELEKLKTEYPGAFAGVRSVHVVGENVGTDPLQGKGERLFDDADTVVAFEIGQNDTAVGPASSWLTPDSGGVTSTASPQSPHAARIAAMTTPSVATPAAAPTATVDADGHGGVVGKLKDKLIERSWRELTKRHDVSSHVDVGDAALGVRLSERVIRGDSEFVKNNPVRAATTERLANESGKSVFWLETGGLMDADVGLAKSLPISGGHVSGHVGFHAEALLEYRALHPHTASAGAVAKDLMKNHSVRVPVDAARAQEMEPGTQVEIVGQGTARLSIGLGTGVSASVGDVTASLSAGVSGSSSRRATWSIGVTRLGGDRVRVVLSDVNASARGATARVDASIGLGSDAVLGNAPADTGSGGGSVAELLEKEGGKQLERAVRRYTAFHASRSRTTSETRTEVTSYVLDLSTPAGRAAYDDLVRLDESAAKALSDGSSAGVTRHVYDEVATAKSDKTRVTFAGVKLLLVNALRQEADGTLTTGAGTELVRTSRYSRRHKGIIGGDSDIKWEGVRVTDAATGEAEHFFHMRFEKNDKITRKSEVEEFVRFADYLGARDADNRDVTPVASNFFSRLFGSKDNSRVKADVYFSADGVQRIAESDKAAVVTAFVDAAVALNPEIGEVPLGDAEAVKIIAEYADLAAKREALKSHHFDDDGGDEDDGLRHDQYQARKRYEAAGYDKGELAAHAAAYAGGTRLAARVAEMGTDEASAWTRFFADLGEASRFDYMGSIAALADLAGADNTLLHEVSLDGGGLHLRAVDEGSLTDPSAAITAATLGQT